MYMMEAGSQTDPLETQAILNLLEKKSIELQQTTTEENETQKVIDETGKSSPNPKNEFQCENVSCTGTEGGLPPPYTSSPTLTPNQTSGKEKLENFSKITFSDTDDQSYMNNTKRSKKILLGRSHSFKGSSYSSSSTSKLFADSFSRRASGGQSLIRPSGNANGHGKLFQSGSCYGYPPTSSRARSSDKFRTNGAEPYIRRHISTTLSIPSRQASVRSCSSARSYNSDSKGNNIKAALTNTYNLNRHTANSSSMKSLPYAGRASRSNSIFSITGGIPLKDLPPKERRHRKVAYAVFFVSSFLLTVAVLCIIVSLHLSPRIDKEVRKENESLMSVIRPTEPTLNSTSTAPTNGMSSKETNSGGISGSVGSRTTTASSTELINENSLNNNNKEGPPISQSLIGGILLEKRQFYSKTTVYPTVLNIFGIEELAMAVKKERNRKI